MKIVMLTPFFAPHTGGTEKYVRDISTELTARGHTIRVISTDLPRGKKPRHEMMDGIEVIRLPALDVFYLPLVRGIPEKFFEGFDLIHSHGPAFHFTARAIRYGRLPHVVTFHCDTTVSGKALGLPIPSGVVNIVESIANRYIRRLLPRVNAMICTTRSYAESSPVASQFPYHAIPIGIHWERFDQVRQELPPNQIKRNPHQVLFVGRLAANKGVEYLVEAMKDVIRTIPDARLVIAGEGEEKAHIISQINRWGLAPSVQFYGTMTFPELVQLYSTSAVFVLPSVNRLEAFGIVQLEAMACQTPVIASDIPGVNNVMEPGKTGLLVPQQNPPALAAAILELLNHPPRAEQMGHSARQLVERRYTWKGIIDQIEHVYREAQEHFRRR